MFSDQSALFVVVIIIIVIINSSIISIVIIVKKNIYFLQFLVQFGTVDTSQSYKKYQDQPHFHFLGSVNIWLF